MLKFKLLECNNDIKSSKIIITSFSKPTTTPLERKTIKECKILSSTIFTERNYFKESMARAKSRIIDYCYSNEWNYFLTCTFDKEKIDRYDTNLCLKKFLKFLNNYKVVDKSFKYLIIPELHEDGAIHFHGLVYFGDDSLSYLVKANTKRKKNLFNHKMFSKSFGFNTFAFIHDFNAKVINYILKYIKKSDTKIFRNYYFHSKNLILPKTYTIEDTDLCYQELNKLLSVFPYDYENKKNGSLCVSKCFHYVNSFAYVLSLDFSMLGNEKSLALFTNYYTKFNDLLQVKGE